MVPPGADSLPRAKEKRDVSGTETRRDSRTDGERERAVKLEIENEEGGYEALYSPSEPSSCTASGNSSDIDEEETIFDVRSSVDGQVGETENGETSDSAEPCAPTQAQEDKK